MKDNNSLAHTTWNCKYHIVFAPKYRRQAIYGKYKASIGQIIRELCQRKGIEMIEANACRDHIHMLVSITPKLSVSAFMGYLKGKSSLMIFDRHAHLKYRYGKKKDLIIFDRGYPCRKLIAALHDKEMKDLMRVQRSFYPALKKEEVYQKTYVTFEQARIALFQYIEGKSLS